RLQIDDEIGRRGVAGEQIVETLVNEQLVIVEVQVREDLVLVEQIVGDRELAEQVRLAERGLLTMPIQQVEKLGLKRRARTIRVEVGEKRIFVFLEHECRVE